MDAPSVSPRCLQHSVQTFSALARFNRPGVRASKPLTRAELLPCTACVFVRRQAQLQSKSTRRLTRALSSAKGSTLSLQETATLDKLIDLMLSAKGPDELGKITGENLLAFDQKFWLRLATRSDTAASADEKKRLQDLAGVTMRMVDAMVKRSETQLSDSAQVLQKILVAAADEQGQWQLPLSDEKVEAMRKEVNAHADALDESLLANAFAWMRKAKADNLDGTVALLQQALQLYSARALAAGGDAPDDALLNEVLALRDAAWVPRLQALAAAGRLSKAPFMAAIRRRMETVVLALPSGSYAQRVQAEYLKELETRADAALDA